MDTAVGSADFTEDGSGNCYPSVQVATMYKNGQVMNYTGGMCGFKYQVTNKNVAYNNKFKVLKDSATTLFASSALALAAAALIF